MIRGALEQLSELHCLSVLGLPSSVNLAGLASRCHFVAAQPSIRRPAERRTRIMLSAPLLSSHLLSSPLLSPLLCHPNQYCSSPPLTSLSVARVSFGRGLMKLVLTSRARPCSIMSARSNAANSEGDRVAGLAGESGS